MNLKEPCPFCPQTFKRVRLLLAHIRRVHRAAGPAAGGRIVAGEGQDVMKRKFPYPPSEPLDILQALTFHRPQVYELCSQYLEAGPLRAKMFFSLEVTFVKYDQETGNVMQRETAHLRSLVKFLRHPSEFTLLYDHGVSQIWASFDAYLNNGSGFVLERIVGCHCQLFPWQPWTQVQARGTAGAYLPTPLALANKGAIQNCRNGARDEHCLKYAILQALHAENDIPHAHWRLPSALKRFEDQYSWRGMGFPSGLADVELFERNNREVAINVVEARVGRNKLKCDLIPIRVSPHVYRRARMVNLCLITEQDKSHFTWLRHPGRILKTHKTKTSELCWNCLSTFRGRTLEAGKAKLEKHLILCLKQSTRQLRFPREKMLSFRNYANQLKSHFVIYADFESILEPVAPEPGAGTKSEVTSHHQPGGFSIRVVAPECYKAEFPMIEYRQRTRSDENAAYRFCRELWTIYEKLDRILGRDEDMQELTEAQAAEFESSTHCMMCEEPFTCPVDHQNWVRLMAYRKQVLANATQAKRLMPNSEAAWVRTILDMGLAPLSAQDYRDLSILDHDPVAARGARVRDHDHVTGAYRGIVHSRCNLLARKRREVSCFFHNGSKYDNHHVLSQLFNLAADREQQGLPCFQVKHVIGKTSETLMKIDLDGITIKDSFNFLSSSLDALVSSLRRKEGARAQVFPQTWDYFLTKYGARFKPEELEIQFEKLLRKSIYPYEFVTDFSVLEESGFPPLEAFTSSLSGPASEEHYLQGLDIYQSFGCQCLGDYSELYQSLDVNLLADVFENFRSLSHSKYSLDPVYYSSSPGLTWDAALKYTKAKIQLLDDVDMHQFVNEGLCGGYSAAHIPLAQANNIHMTDYQPHQPLDTYLLYLDANNLYGAAMSQSLPQSGFEWVEDHGLTEASIRSTTDEEWNQSEVGYFVEVDCDYPPELHEDHNFFPLMPSTEKITAGMLSPDQVHLAEQLNIKLGHCSKVVTSFLPKRSYVTHIRNLSLYLKLGVRLKKIHRVLRFQQAPFLQSYIAMNTDLRREAQDETMKAFAKLMVNSLYGKTCENVERFRDIRLVTTREALLRCVRNPNFTGGVYYEAARFASVELKKSSILLNKPRHIGCAVLALSKIIMYSFFYDWLKPQYPRSEVCFTDTDSLCLKIDTEPGHDLYAALRDSDMMDFSNYPHTHPNFSMRNYLTPGKFKDECGGTPISSVVSLCAKMYSLEMQGGGRKMAAKGISRQAQASLSHADYLTTFQEDRRREHVMHRLGVKHHQIMTLKEKRFGLNAFNDKRYQTKQGLNYAFGHCKIPVWRPWK